MRAGLAAADGLAAPTDAFRAALAAAWGRLPPAFTIRNGGDLPAEPGRAPRQPGILAAGRFWDEAKGLADLAAAATGLSWPVMVAGELQDAGLPASLTGLGRLSTADLHARMAEAAIYAAPARYEPFGLAVLEAARAGCTLVLAAIPTLRELWQGAACFVPPREPAALHRALAALIEDEPERQRLQRAARKRALTYGAERMVEGYLALYGRLLAAHSPQRAMA